jgi:signal transduction histidine kinase
MQEDLTITFLQFIELLLMITLTTSFIKRLPKNIFILRIVFILLFLFSFFPYLRLLFYLNRWFSLILNGASFFVGVYAFLQLRKAFSGKKVILSHNIINWILSNNNTRLELDFGIDKPVAPDEIRNWIHEIAVADNRPAITREPEVFVRGLTSQAMQLKVYVWCNDINMID